MQTSGVFPELYAGRKKGAGKSASKQSKGKAPVAEDGRGWTSRQPRPINAPKTTAGRRAAARKKAAMC